MQEPPVLDVSAEAKVHELGVDAAAPAQQNVLQLDIAVNDVRAVHVLHLDRSCFGNRGYIHAHSTVCGASVSANKQRHSVGQHPRQSEAGTVGLKLPAG